MDRAGAAAAARLDLADAELRTRALPAALADSRRAGALAALAVAHDPTVKLWREERDRAWLVEAAIYAAEGDGAAALALDQRALGDLADVAGPGLNTDGRWLIARGHLQAGDALAHLGRAGSARAEWSSVAADLGSPVNALAPRLLQLLAAADLRLGRAQEGRAAQARLAAILRPA
jgi:hypothetical protein